MVIIYHKTLNNKNFMKEGAYYEQIKWFKAY